MLNYSRCNWVGVVRFGYSHTYFSASNSNCGASLSAGEFVQKSALVQGCHRVANTAVLRLESEPIAWRSESPKAVICAFAGHNCTQCRLLYRELELGDTVSGHSICPHSMRDKSCLVCSLGIRVCPKLEGSGVVQIKSTLALFSFWLACLVRLSLLGRTTVNFCDQLLVRKPSTWVLIPKSSTCDSMWVVACNSRRRESRTIEIGCRYVSKSSVFRSLAFSSLSGAGAKLPFSSQKGQTRRHASIFDHE